MKPWAVFTACALGLAFCSLGYSADPDAVTVRVVDGRNGKPYTRFPVRVAFNRVKERNGFKSLAEARANVAGTACEKTNAKGEVTFPLPKPLPEELDVVLGPFGCGASTFDMREVVQKGVVGEDLCKGKLRTMNVKFQARPGEVVVFAAPIGFWESVFH